MKTAKMKRKLFLWVSLALALTTALGTGALLSDRAIAADPAVNLGIVQQMFNDFESVDLSTLSSQFADNVEWIQPGGPSVPLAGVYKGPQAVIDLFQRIDDTLDILDFQPRGFLTQGNQVVFRGWLQARVKPDGQPFSLDFVQLWTLQDDGKISRVEGFADTAELARVAAAAKMTPGLASPATTAEQSSAAQNEQVARSLFESFNTGNLDVLDQYLAATFISHDPQSPLLDPSLWRQAIIGDRQAFPDLHFNIDDVLAQGNEVVLHWTATGTNMGSFMGMPATKAKMTSPGTSILRFDNGKVVEETSNWDVLGILQQLGLAPALNTAPR
jgi:steroid delta-isomerase-like uncharacterized protein